MATLQQQVQQHLQNTGISLRELSRRSGISHQAIGNILRDTDLECAKYRRVMALEKELNDEKRNFAALEQVHDHVAGNLKSCENALIEAHETITKQEQQLNDANTAYLSSKSQHDRDLQRLSDANAEIKRLTALSETHGQRWKAACVQAEQLQKQLDHANSEIVRMDAKLDQALETSQKNAASAFESALNRDALQSRFDTLFVERENAATLHDQQVIRLRVRCFALVCAIVLLIVSGLLVWGVV